MNKKGKIRIIGIAILVAALASIADRVCYLKFLNKNGYNSKDIFAPVNLIIDYHLQFPGNLFSALIILPILSLVLFWAINSLEKGQ